MEVNDFVVIPEKLQGKIVEEIAITSKAVVIKFTDGTFLDIYLHPSGRALKTSTNKLED